jgi:ketosteroid isomerase-like protein
MADTATTRRSELQELLDKHAIREVIMRYCRGVDRCDAALISSAYHSDAIDLHGSRNFTGATVGRGLVDGLEATAKRSMHHVTNQVIHVNGDIAGCESYYAAFRVEDHDGEERVLQALGRYVDRLERRDGEWRIAHRVVVNEIVRYLPPESFPVNARTDLASRDGSDPSYAALDI